MKLQGALATLTELAASSTELFDDNVRKQLQSLYPKADSRPIYPLLNEWHELSENDKKALSPHCYKFDESAKGFDDVLDGLEAYYKQMDARYLVDKGEIIDAIVHSDVPKNVRSSLNRVLDVIGSLTLISIRDLEAQALATSRGHELASTEDKSNAASQMWDYLYKYNDHASRDKLDTKLEKGNRWKRYLGGISILSKKDTAGRTSTTVCTIRPIGAIVVGHKVSPGLYVAYPTTTWYMLTRILPTEGFHRTKSTCWHALRATLEVSTRRRKLRLSYRRF